MLVVDSISHTACTSWHECVQAHILSIANYYDGGVAGMRQIKWKEILQFERDGHF